MEKLLNERDLDGEWVQLMIIARDYGFSPQQIRVFLAEKNEEDDGSIKIAQTNWE